MHIWAMEILFFGKSVFHPPCCKYTFFRKK
jgi:hypothetical protein